MELINTELAQLTLKNVQLIEQSYDVLAKLDKHFCEKLNAIFDEWYEEIKKDTPEWYRTSNKKDEEKYSIWFDWNMNFPEKTEALNNGFHWISCFAGLGKYENDEEIRCGIHFGFNRDFFNLKALEAKEFMKMQLDKYPDLIQSGFQYMTDGREDRTIFIPVQLDLETLVAEYPDYDDKAFEPLIQALDTIRKNLAIFKAIAAELNAQYFKSEQYAE